MQECVCNINGHKSWGKKLGCICNYRLERWRV